MSKPYRFEPKKLLIRYVLALTILVLFLIGTHGLHLVVSKQGALDEEVLNISGRQRMLSQRIVLLSHRLNEDVPGIYNELLDEALTTFEESHSWILAKAVTEGTAVELHFTGPIGANLDKKARAFASLGRNLLEQKPGSYTALAIAQELEDMALVGLLADLNTAVTLFENVANDRSERLEKIQVAALLAALFVLLVEVLLVFYPAHRSMTKMIERLRQQAWRDHLTGLANRTRLMSRMEEVIRDDRSKQNLTFALALDLDGFKQVNDTLGHPVGDQVLQHVAGIIEQTLAYDEKIGEHCAARLGGDEFLVFGHLPEGDIASYVRDLSQRLINKIEDPIGVSLGNDRFGNCVVGASIGFAFGKDTEQNTDVLLSDADIALYVSKERGKGIATAFEQAMRSTAETRHRLSTELKAAVKQMEFCAFFQPQICLISGKMVGVEALARWQHPQRGLIGPKDFMSMAEDAHIIDALDGQIMLSAFETYQQSKTNGIDLGQLSLNASGLALRHSNFCDALLNIAQAHHIKPNQITVEILENVLIQEESDPAMETIRRLSRCGFGIAIDDFGVGYSSLSKISQGEITAVKIDRSMVQQYSKPSMFTVLKATAAMAKGINAHLFAEGIETDQQRKQMYDLGVEIGQGFLWSRPLQKDDLTNWVNARRSLPPRILGKRLP